MAYRFWIGIVGALWLGTGSALAADHPLEPLDASEIGAAFRAVQEYFRADPRLPDEPLRFPFVALLEPPKSFVLGWRRGQAIPRRAELHVLHYPSDRLWVAEVDLAKRRVSALREQPLGTQAALSSEEYGIAASLVRAHEPWRRALRARGVDPDGAYIDPWAPGENALPPDLAAKLPFGQHTRLIRCLTFQRPAQPAPPPQVAPASASPSPAATRAVAPTAPSAAPPRAASPAAARPESPPAPSAAAAPAAALPEPPAVSPPPAAAPTHPYARPVEGLIVTVDMNARQVVSMTDSGARPVSSERGTGKRSLVLKPLRVEQPQGSDIQIRGRHVRWHGWQFLAVLHPREGLVLYDVRFDDHGGWRPIAYRMSLSEIYVPYGLGDPDWVWRSAFDVGEYNAGVSAQRLEVDRDVPPGAQLLDALFFSDVGPTEANPNGVNPLPGTLGLYERNAGWAWTRTEPGTNARDTRQARELVATWNCILGNYVYGFDWIFALDGSIAVKIHLAGTTLNRGSDARSETSAPKVGKDGRGAYVAAPDHQHFLNFRLDLDIDGPKNSVLEMEAANVLGSSFKNAFSAVTRPLEREGFRDVDPFSLRHWHIESATRKNAFGKPTGFALEPAEFAVPYSADDFPGLLRAQFAEHQFWVTRYRAHELYASGLFPNQNSTSQGLVQFVQPAEPVNGEDVVIWYTTGFTHLARPEDYPVMPSKTIGFRVVPRGFFAGNPSLDLADQAAAR